MGATNTYASILSFLPEQYRGRQLRPFYMPLTTAAALASGTAIPLSTSIQNVAAFLLVSIVGRVYTAAAPTASIADPALTIETAFTSGDNLDSGAVPWSAVVDDQGAPSPIPGGLVIPRLVPGGSSIRCNITNYSGVAYLIRLGLAGINVYSA